MRPVAEKLTEFEQLTTSLLKASPEYSFLLAHKRLIDSDWSISADIYVNGELVGSIDVVSSEKCRKAICSGSVTKGFDNLNIGNNNVKVNYVTVQIDYLIRGAFFALLTYFTAIITTFSPFSSPTSAQISASYKIQLSEGLTTKSFYAFSGSLQCSLQPGPTTIGTTQLTYTCTKKQGNVYKIVAV